VLQSMLPWRAVTTAAETPASTFAADDAAARPQTLR